MDPRIPYSQSAGYMGLLHSQHESVHHENSPYETSEFYKLTSDKPKSSGCPLTKPSCA
ncbi:hypothetical protein YC2023_085038 [Brassica napus]